MFTLGHFVKIIQDRGFDDGYDAVICTEMDLYANPLTCLIVMQYLA